MSGRRRSWWRRVGGPIGIVVASTLLAASTDEQSPVSSTGWVEGMRVEQTGTGTPVVLLPGSMCGPWEWQATVEALRRDHTVYAVAFPGFDGEPAPADDSDLIGRYTDEVVALISTRHLKGPVVIGHSIGATIALHLAATHPDLVSGVVAVDGLPVFPGTAGLTAQQRAAGADHAAAAARAVRTPQAQLDYARNYLLKTGVIDASSADRYAPMMARSDFGTAAEYLREDLLLDERAEMSAATVPIFEIVPYYTLFDGVYFSSADTKVAYYRSMLGAAPHLTVVSIEPAKHFVMLDQPAGFEGTVRGILDEVNASRP